MSLFLIRVDGLLHHATSDVDEHEEYADQLRSAGREVTTEKQS